MTRSLAGAAVAALSVMSSVGFAAPVDEFLASSERRSLPDARLMSADARVAAQSGFATSIEPRLGVPTFFWSAPPAPGARSFRTMGLSAEQAARRFLVAHAELYRASAGRWAEARVTRLHDLGDKGAVIVTFQQNVRGVKVFRDELKVIMNSELQLIALSGYLTPEVKVKGEFSLADTSAIASAYQMHSGRGLERDRLKPLSVDAAGFTRYALEAESTPVRVRPVFFPLSNGVAPAFHVELDLRRDDTDSDYAAFVISAVDGSVLFSQSLTAADSFAYRVWADPVSHFPIDGPQGAAATPHPTGLLDGFHPPFVLQSLVTLQNGPIANNDPWLAAGATETAGNNVRAYVDVRSPNGYGAGDIIGAVSSPGAFDRVFDPTIAPNANTTQQIAAVTQLFYDNNFFHDWYYDVGFDEKAGNAQALNFGRGGAQGDAVQAEGQDYSGRNNANMSTPSDGASPRMQMYIFDGGSTNSFTLATTPARSLSVTGASFGPQSFTVTGEVVLAQNDMLTNGCTAITNNVTGKIALIDRGSCTFIAKAQAAQAAGAAAVIIIDNVAGATPPGLQGTGMTTTPTMSVTQASGMTLRTLAAGTTATLTRVKQTDADGTIDNAIVAHEWGHYISNRLIGDGNGISNNQGGGLGEGWGDFHSMLLLVRAEDTMVATNATWNGVYGMAAYTSGATDPQGYYFGIRRLPYSTDMAKNGLTFKHISNGIALPSNVPTAFGLNGANNAEVHNSGEVWATMLWECYAALLKDPRYSFVQAQDRMRGYIVAGYKATPLMPTFVDARDAILAVASAKDATDYATLWAAFARRGIGMGAVAPGRDSQTNSPVVESFVVGNSASITEVKLDDSVKSCDRDGNLDAKEDGLLTITVKNVGIAALTNASVKVTTTTAGLTLGNGGMVSLPSTPPFGLNKVTVPVSLGDVAGIKPATFSVTVNDSSLVGGPVKLDALFRLNFDTRPNGSATDDVEAPMSRWTSASDPNGETGSDFRIFEASATEHYWFGPNPAAPADTWLISPALQVGTTPFTITFKHRWDFEKDATTNYDGAVIELSTDDGATWADIGDKAMPGYSGALSADAQSSNPLKGQKAYVGKSANYPNFITETISLGTGYANRNVKFRFRIGSDDAAAAKGWEVDDITFSGITNTPFTTVVGDPNMCTNKAPVATVADQEVDERSMVTLTATVSDPDGDTLTSTWTQSSGPMVQLTGATFTAPSVDADTVLTFSLSVTDGRAIAGPFVKRVTVKNINQPPLASAPAAVEVNEGASVAIVGTGSDPEGGAVTYEWHQVSGPAATLENATTDTVAVTGPFVTADSVVALELVVKDAQGIVSAPARVDVLVKDIGTADGKPTGCGCNQVDPSALFGLAALGLMLRRRRASR